jgi:hypothetical protein
MWEAEMQSPRGLFLDALLCRYTRDVPCTLIACT